MDIHIKKLHDQAVLPKFAHTSDAGMDVCSVEEVTIAPGERVLVPTGLAMAIPEGYVALVWDKSGIATKRGVTTLAGVIDAGYRGEIKIALLNTGDKAQSFVVGDKIAQLLIQPITQPALTEVSELDDTQRGEGGFGSTGR